MPNEASMRQTRSVYLNSGAQLGLGRMARPPWAAEFDGRKIGPRNKYFKQKYIFSALNTS
jgi:hypothetical protein